MSIITLTSIGASPGITTAAISMATNWNRPVVLLEADISKPSSVITGFMGGQINSTRGLDSLSSVAALQGLEHTNLHESFVPLTADPLDAPEEYDKYLLAGMSKPAAAQSHSRFWSVLMPKLQSLSHMGLDVLIDYGRWQGSNDARAALVTHADWVVIGQRMNLAATAATYSRVKEITEARSHTGHTDHQSLLGFVPAFGGQSMRAVEKLLGLSSIGKIPFSPRWASVFSDGEVPPTGLKKGTYQGSIRGVVSSLEKKLAVAEELLNPAFVQEVQDV